MLIKDPNEKVPEGEEDLWLTREQVAEKCPPCAVKMKERGIIRIRANLFYNERLQQWFNDEIPKKCEDC